MSVTDLSIDEIGVKDTIFHLGADSITAMKMVMAPRKHDIAISATDLFGHPTIYELSEVFHTRNPQRQAVCSVVPGSIFGFTSQRSFIESIDCSDLPFNTSDIYDALPTLKGQKDKLLRGSYYFMLDFNRPIDSARLERACRGLTQRHTIFRTVFIPYQGRMAQIVLRSSDAPIDILKSDDCLLADPIEYSAHVQKWLMAGTPQAYEFWRNLLDGSSMTYINQKHLATEDSPVSLPIYGEYAIALPDPPNGVTIATVIKAAWSLVLSQLTGTRDIVFGQTNSGRSSRNFDAENLVGLCINILPVRVKYYPNWTVLDLLRHLQNQPGDSLPFESVEFCDIVAQGTPWPQGTRFGSIVTHQNIDVEKPTPAGGTEPSIRMFHQDTSHSHASISTSPLEQGLSVQLRASDQTFSTLHAQEVAQDLGETIISIASYPDGPISGYLDDKLLQ